jgi:hypothetical protein
MVTAAYYVEQPGAAHAHAATRYKADTHACVKAHGCGLKGSKPGFACVSAAPVWLAPPASSQEVSNGKEQGACGELQQQISTWPWQTRWQQEEGQ